MRPTAAECGTRDGPVRYASDVFMPDPVTLLELATILAITGVVAGLLAGLLGVGGGIVIVPVLFQMFALIDVPETIRMHLAVGTSLTTIVATAAISTRAHHRRGETGRASWRERGCEYG